MSLETVFIALRYLVEIISCAEATFEIPFH
jgi:hypothetical protein